MKKLFVFAFIFLCFMPTLAGGIVLAENDSPTYIVCSNSANVYQSSDMTSTIVYTISHKDKIDVELDGASAKIYTNLGYSFYKITTVGKEGYILADFAVKMAEELQEIPNFNARTNGPCVVYNKVGDEYVETSISLEKGAKLFLYEGYKSKNPYTAVSFVLDNQVLYGYLKSESIDPNGINPAIITCACLILAILGIMFTFLFIKGRKKKMS